MSDSPGLLDFAIGLVNSVLNLPDGQVKYFEKFNVQKNCEINSAIKKFGGLVETMFGVVNASENDFLCTLEEKFAWNDDNCFFKMYVV